MYIFDDKSNMYSLEKKNFLTNIENKNHSACVLYHFSCLQLFATPCTVALQAPLSTDSASKNTEVDCHALLQGIFLTQGSNLRLLCLLQCRWILYH